MQCGGAQSDCVHPDDCSLSLPFAFTHPAASPCEGGIPLQLLTADGKGPFPRRCEQWTQYLLLRIAPILLLTSQWPAAAGGSHPSAASRRQARPRQAPAPPAASRRPAWIPPAPGCVAYTKKRVNLPPWCRAGSCSCNRHAWTPVLAHKARLSHLSSLLISSCHRAQCSAGAGFEIAPWCSSGGCAFT